MQVLFQAVALMKLFSETWEHRFSRLRSSPMIGRLMRVEVFVTDTIQDPMSPLFSDSLLLSFNNTGTVNKVLDVRLKVVSADSCTSFSNPITITVFPTKQAGFSESNYDPLANNCSPQTINFEVNAATHLLGADSYVWNVSDIGGVLISENHPGNDPFFAYTFETDTLVSKMFQVTLAGN